MVIKIRKKFCPKCGKETDLYDGFCDKCRLTKLSFVFKLPDVIKIKKCKYCENFFVEKKEFDSIEDVLDNILNVLKQPDVKNATYRIVNNKLHVTLAIKHDNLEKSESKEINIFIRDTVCYVCSMENSGYYQTIIQLRMPDSILKNVLDFIFKEIDRMHKNDKFAFISSTKKTKDGTDLYIGSKHAANKISNNVKIKYKTSVKVTSKLSGAISGKKAYKDTILISIDGKYGKEKIPTNTRRD